jgi:hypothetical protein
MINGHMEMKNGASFMTKEYMEMKNGASFMTKEYMEMKNGASFMIKEYMEMKNVASFMTKEYMKMKNGASFFTNGHSKMKNGTWFYGSVVPLTPESLFFNNQIYFSQFGCLRDTVDVRGEVRVLLQTACVKGDVCDSVFSYLGSHLLCVTSYLFLC